MYYIWYKVDEGGTPTLLVDADGKADGVDLMSAYAKYLESSSSSRVKNSLYIEFYDPKNAAEDPSETEGFKAFIPAGYEYASVADVPWKDVMGVMEYVVFVEGKDGVDGIEKWTNLQGVSNIQTRYMSNWFNGASKLYIVYAHESLFYASGSEQCSVSGTNIFTGCTSLLGANGSSIDTLKQTGTAALHEDYYTINKTTPVTYEPHFGLLSFTYPNIIYNYQYGGKVVEWQYVEYNNAFTVGGVNNNIAPVPTVEGYRFVGWQVGDNEENVFQPGTILPVADYVTETSSNINIKAIWEEEPEPEVVPPTRTSDFYYDAEAHNVIASAGSVTEGHTLYYNVTDSSEVTPESGWSTDSTSFKTSDPGKYYI